MLSIVIPTLKDRSLAPAGEHLVILKAIAPVPAGTLQRRTASSGHLANWKSAVCVVPSSSVTLSCRQVPVQAGSVFQT